MSRNEKNNFDDWLKNKKPTWKLRRKVHAETPFSGWLKNRKNAWKLAWKTAARTDKELDHQGIKRKRVLSTTSSQETQETQETHKKQKTHNVSLDCNSAFKYFGENPLNPHILVQIESSKCHSVGLILSSTDLGYILVDEVKEQTQCPNTAGYILSGLHAGPTTTLHLRDRYLFFLLCTVLTVVLNVVTRCDFVTDTFFLSFFMTERLGSTIRTICSRFKRTSRQLFLRVFRSFCCFKSILQVFILLHSSSSSRRRRKSNKMNKSICSPFCPHGIVKQYVH